MYVCSRGISVNGQHFGGALLTVLVSSVDIPTSIYLE